MVLPAATPVRGEDAIAPDRTGFPPARRFR